ncbi:MAG TPA: tail fiber domain-containing protein [Saprospiraceae bacterium]|nr:tail fiber domain-containing protein [Saprospiraceae bacterium]
MKRILALFITYQLLLIPSSWSQNIGIGTPTPAGKLHVKGAANISQLIIDANGTQSNTSPLMKLRNSLGTDLMWIHSDNVNNTFIGLNAGRVNNAAGGGTNNTFLGRDAGYSNTTGYWNSAIGVEALYSNTIGYYNTAHGISALKFNTTGHSNTANGLNALVQNTTGYSNTATGRDALYSNTTGYWNTANGQGALLSNTIGHSNTAVGLNALVFNTTGNFNTAIGRDALFSNTTGSENTANGNGALLSNTTGFSNTANGVSVLKNNTSGVGNTAMGHEALYSNTTGYSNTANGASALKSNISGVSNTANGMNALGDNSIGSFNTATGSSALNNNIDGASNTAYGASALHHLDMGDYNTAIGANAGNSSGTTPSNLTALGYNAGQVASNSNRVEIGNSSVSWVGGETGWFLYSDQRIKDNIQSNVPGLSFINKLNPVTYNLNIHRQNIICGISDTAQWEGKYDIERITQSGFIAQEVELAALTSYYDFNGVQAPAGNDKLYSLQYASFVVPLVKAAQELSVRNDEQDVIIQTLTKRIEQLEALISDEQLEKG